jgi:UDP-3-O-[3-hydroxymyristoyl] glucosamine N-acyltransferase
LALETEIPRSKRPITLLTDAGLGLSGWGCWSKVRAETGGPTNAQDERLKDILSLPDRFSHVLGRPPSAPFREERQMSVVATVEELATLVSGRLVGDGHVAIQSARPVAEAGPGDITFIDDERYAKLLRHSPASAAIVGPHFKKSSPGDRDLPVIEVDDPRSAFLAVRSHLKGNGRERWTGIHPLAHVSPSARIGAGVAIYPFVYVGEDSVIGDGSTLCAGVVVGDDCRIGCNTMLHPHVVLYEGVTLGDRVEIHAGTVLGADGFGYRLTDGRHVKMPQTGTVDVHDDVEIGSNCTIDRGTFEATVIGEGSKIDNLVMIGHNNRIGKHNLLCGQVGIAGSCKTGDYVVMAGQAGIKDHTEIGEKSTVGAQAGVHRSVPANQQVLGSPAIPVREQRRIFQMIARLPDFNRQLRELATQVALLTAANPHEDPPDLHMDDY